MNLVTMVLACSLYPDNSITNAMVEVGSQNNPLTITITDNGHNTTKTFKNEAAALSYVNKETAQGHAVNIGLLQIPNSWIAKYPSSMGANIAGLLRPCKNMVVATDLLNDATEQCASVDGDKTACALSVFHTGSPTAGQDYAKQVIDYAVEHPFVKPPSILEQVPATPDNSNAVNATNTNNNVQADNANSDNTAANNSSSGDASSNNNAVNNNQISNSTNPDKNSSSSPSNNSDGNLQKSLTQQLNNHAQNNVTAPDNNDMSNSDQNTDQPVAADQASLPPVVNGDNSDN